MRHLAPNSVTLYRQHLDNHIAPALGHLRIGTVSAGDVDAFIAGLDLALATVHTVYAILHRLLRSAVRDGLLAANPAEGTELPRRPRRDWDPVSAETVQQLAEVISPRYRVAVMLAAGTGMRQGEILGLAVPRVDFLRRQMHVAEQLQGGVLCAPKTGKSYRTIPADPMIIGEVSRHLEQFGTANDLGLLITTERGTPVSRSLFGTRWRAATVRAGVPGLRFHDLPHWYCSQLIRSGMNVRLVQEIMGHSSATITWDTYSHIFEEDREQTRGVITAAFGSAQIAQ